MTTDLKSKFRDSGQSCFVIGFTGEVGKALVQELAHQKLFQRVVLIGRRNVDLKVPGSEDFEQHVIDYENMASHEASFKHDVGFCCLGTTRAKAGKAGFRRVDYDYTLQSAQIAKAQGCKHFQLVSSASADSGSCFLYMQVKGEVESAITALALPRLSIYRPKFLICDREERRPAEVFMSCLCACCFSCCMSTIGTPTDLLARAMLNNTVLLQVKPAAQVLENNVIFVLGKHMQ